MEKDYNYYFLKTKMEKYITSLLIISFLCIACKSIQVPQTEFLCESFDIPISQFKVDPFGNIYTVDGKNKLRLLNSEMTPLFEYFNNGLGDITYIDISNPRKIILFFKGFQKMLFLDNTLSEIGRINQDYNLPYDIRAIGSSRDNNIWIYDAFDYKLKKIDAKGMVVLESNPLESYLELSITPEYIIEYDNETYIVEEGKGIAVFDNFGTFLRYVSCNECSSISFHDKSMFYVKNNIFYQQVLANNLIAPAAIKPLPMNSKGAQASGKDLYFLDQQCLKKERLIK